VIGFLQDIDNMIFVLWEDLTETIGAENLFIEGS